MVKKSEGGGDFRAIKPHQIGPENPGNRISEALTEIKNFPEENAPGLPLGAIAFGGRLSEPPFVKSWIRPRSFSRLP